ncbi:MAG TPA: HK97-gp10 family putative phage morphogenesis protein [Vicinamibacterales bacterium]|nr:HK97-gp10 family putative phage morphogenesis protein [Vicinamibacterales bacterium]
MPSQFIAIDFSGFDELEAALDELGRSLAKQVLQKAMKLALQPVADEARLLAPRSDDPEQKLHLADSIVVRATLNKNQRRLRFRAGTDVGFAEAFVGATAPHAHLVEFGHVLVRSVHSQKAQYRHVIIAYVVIGHVPAHPFMRPAWDARRDQAWAIFKVEIWNVIVTTARRVRRQAESGTISRTAANSLVGSAS